MKRIITASLLGLTAAFIITGCGGSDTDDRYAAGWSDDYGQAYETDGYENRTYETYDTGDQTFEYDYNPETGWYNEDAGYYYGSKERHSIIQDPNDYESGSGW